MSCVSDWVERLEAAESERSRVSRPTARRIVARRLGLLPGTLENIVRGRVKQMREAVTQKGGQVEASYVINWSSKVRNEQIDSLVTRCVQAVQQSK